MQHTDSPFASTGIAGLDSILGGGLPEGRLHLIEGDPGSGKTTLGLQFLQAGARQNERSMFVSLSETIDELYATAKSHGWDLQGIDIYELTASAEKLQQDSRYTMFHPSEVELSETTKAVLAEVERIEPKRVVVDSLSEFRLLADEPLRYRRQILALKQYFTRRGCTVLFVDDRIGPSQDRHLQSLAHGVIQLDRSTPEYGTIRRRIQIIKMRGQAFQEGYHDFAIQRGGVEVFPRLIAADHRATHDGEAVSCGLQALDRLLGGGLSRGTSTLIMGAAGTGKSSLATQFARQMVDDGQHAAMYIFDESISTLTERAAGLGVDISGHIRDGKLDIRQVDPAELSPGEFSHMIRQTVEKNGTRMVIIDSLNGYLNAMPSDRYLALHLHELLSFLGHRGITTIITMTQHGIVGATDVPLDVSYVADSVILLRYFEAFGQVRQAISVIKKRTGKHERTVRELRFDDGVIVGEPLKDFRGILTGSPEFVGSTFPILPKQNESRPHDK